MTAGPTSLTLRAYQVGFGDCFLLTFHYAEAAEARHVLIDFGSTASPRRTGAGKPLLVRVAEDIRSECGGKLHAIVATHRHRDHIAGFETRKNGKGPGDIIRSLEPDLVIQPWTEDPALEPNAAGPAASGLASPTGAATPAPRGGRTASKAFVQSLNAMQDVAQSVLTEARSLRGIPRPLAQQLAFLGEDNLKNVSAVQNLMTMGKRRVYAHHGSETGIEKLIPGLRVRVLGPPTLEQWGGIRAARAHHESEYWHLEASAGPVGRRRPKALFKNAVDVRARAAPPEARWFIPRVRTLRADSLLELVRVLDTALNNTSLILLFEVGGKKLLFPGDAQIENWSWALNAAPDKDEVRALLADVSVYKVGHHGSLNATPRSLWELFRHKSLGRSPERLSTVLSTLPGKHGREETGTEVPRSTLVKTLQRHSHHISTHALRGRKPRHDLRISL